MFAKQSYWYKLRGLLFKLKAILLVQTAPTGFSALPRAFYWVHIDWLAPGHPVGAGNPTVSRETETQVPAACQPQPRQLHITKLISQLQKPTRKISDTWIIDTGKRETRYRLVKIHQTIRQPPSVLAWRIPGMGEPGGLPSMGSHRVGHDWSDLAAAAGKILDARKLLWCTTNIEIMQDLGHLSLGHVPFIFILLLKWQIYGYIVLWLYRPILSFI